jgi:hypothetical protein
MTANGAYNRTPEATERTMIIRWCMGVMRSRTMDQECQDRRSRSETDELGDCWRDSGEQTLNLPLAAWINVLRIPLLSAKSSFNLRLRYCNAFADAPSQDVVAGAMR